MNAFLASIGYQRWILPVLLIVPLAGAAVIWFQGARRKAAEAALSRILKVGQQQDQQK